MRFSPPADLTPFSGFIFDCDGTLVDTMPLHLRAWRHALSRGGANFDFTWELLLKRAGMSLEGTVRALADEFGQELNVEAIASEQRAHFGRLEQEVVPISEVLEFARQLRSHFPLAVASGSSRASVVACLERIGVLDWFDVILTPENVERGKPEPDMFLLAAQLMQVDPQRCLVIEDGAFGIEAARRAGMHCAIVATVDDLGPQHD